MKISFKNIFLAVLPSINFMEKLIKKNSLKLEKINTYSDDYAELYLLGEKIFLVSGTK